MTSSVNKPTKTSVSNNNILNQFHDEIDLAAKYFFEKQNFEKAKIILDNVLTNQQENDSAHCLLGWIYLETNNIELSEKIDKDLIGGFVIRYNGFVIDASFKNNLLKFKKQLLINN